MKGQVVIFSTSGCPHCRRAKSRLDELGIVYHDINLDVEPSRRDEAVKYSGGSKTVPQIFFNERYIGGADDLLALTSDELTDHIRYVEEHEATDEAPSIQRFSNHDNDVTTESEIEPIYDDDYTIAQQLKNILNIKTHFYGLSHYPKTFHGSDAVSLLMQMLSLESYTDAIDVANRLLNKHFFVHVNKKQMSIFSTAECNEPKSMDNNLLFRWMGDEKTTALNMAEVWKGEVHNASVVAEKLRRLILALYDEFLSADGSQVDYASIAGSEKFKKFEHSTHELQRVDLESLTQEEKLAFFINIYNALVIHAKVRGRQTLNTWQRYHFFNNVSYIMGGLLFTLNGIENGILRAGKKAPFSLSHEWTRSDPRSRIALINEEPRVHAALVCGFKSCPPIKTYNPENIDKQLTSSVQAFLEGGACELIPTQ